MQQKHVRISGYLDTTDKWWLLDDVFFGYWNYWKDYSLVRSTICSWEKSQRFDWAMFKSYVTGITRGYLKMELVIAVNLNQFNYRENFWLSIVVLLVSVPKTLIRNNVDPGRWGYVNIYWRDWLNETSKWTSNAEDHIFFNFALGQFLFGHGDSWVDWSC